MLRGVAPLLLATFSCAVVGCKERAPGEPARPKELTSYTARAVDPGAACSDLNEHRVCFLEACPLGVCVTPRPSASRREARTHRCQVVGQERRCRARAEFASPFVCQRGRCVQRRPRLPDDGEWECTETGGAVLCRGGAAPAGVVRPQAGWGYTCASRPGHPEERLCLDVDPDLPTELDATVRCNFEVTAGRAQRVCVSSEAPRLGNRCQTATDCPAGARCIREVCVPPTLTPACFRDPDCGLERCTLASCGESAG